MAKKAPGIQAILWGVTIGVMVVLLLCHAYGDIMITARHGMNLWSYLFHGDFFRSYALNRVSSGNAYYTAVQGSAYNILIYAVFAIWNIPLVLLEAFAGVDVMNSIPCLVYIKLLPVAAMCASAYLLKKIMGLAALPGKRQKLLLYLYLSSSLMLTVVFIMAQYDLLGLVWQLAGVYAYLKKDYRKFVLAFSIAFCFKYFALILFLPLLLLWCKKLPKLLGMLAIFCAPLLITSLPFGAAVPGAGLSMGLADVLLGKAFTNSLGNLNPFVVAYVLLLVWCYVRRPADDSRDAWRDVVWICFAGYAAFFGLMDLYPYWPVLLAPFLVLALACMPERFRMGLLLETFGLACLVFADMLTYTWCYFGDTMKSMVLSLWPGGANYEGSILYGLIVRLASRPFIVSMFFSAFLAACIALGVLAYPGTKKRPMELATNEEACDDVLIVRGCITAGLCLLPVLSQFI